MAATNAAARVRAYIAKATTLPSNKPMIEGLAILFRGPPSGDSVTVTRLAVRDMEVFLQQVDFAESTCQKLNIPTELYAAQVTQVRRAFSAAAIPQKFSHVQEHLGGDVQSTFAWMAFHLPAEESNPIEADALAELIAALADVRNDPTIDELPVELRAFTIKHLDSLLAALAAYEMAGSAPLQRAVIDLATDLATHDSSIEVEQSEATSKGKSFLKKASDAIRKTVEMVSTTGKTAESVEKILKLADRFGATHWLLGGPPGP